MDQSRKKLIRGIRTLDNFYGLVPDANIVCNSIHLPNEDLWHQRMGHASYKHLSIVSKHESVLGIPKLSKMSNVLGLVPLNPIVWSYVWYYVWHYVWHDVWLNIVINKFVLLLSEIMVTWIFRHYHIVHEMHSMWFMWKVIEDINYKFFVNSEFSS